MFLTKATYCCDDGTHCCGRGDVSCCPNDTKCCSNGDNKFCCSRVECVFRMIAAPKIRVNYISYHIDLIISSYNQTPCTIKCRSASTKLPGDHLLQIRPYCETRRNRNLYEMLKLYFILSWERLEL